MRINTTTNLAYDTNRKLTSPTTFNMLKYAYLFEDDPMYERNIISDNNKYEAIICAMLINSIDYTIYKCNLSNN